MSRADVTGDPEFQAFADNVIKNVLPRLDESAVGVTIVPAKPENWSDIQWCVELGMMIMMDKPIIALVRPGTQVPNKLVLVADRIIETDFQTDDIEPKIMAALADLGITAGDDD